MYLKLGNIVKTIGLKGEVKVFSTTNLARRRYVKGNIVFLGSLENLKKFTIKSYRKIDNNFDAVSFEEINNINDAEDLLKMDIFVEKANNVLKENEFFYVDLENCELYNNGKIIGNVLKVEEFPAQITLKCVSKNNKELMVPFNDFFIKKIDIDNKIIEINLIEGMLWK